MRSIASLNKEDFLIHQASLTMASAFAESYRKNPDSDETTSNLEQFITLRKKLPTVSKRDKRHVGYTESFPRTQYAV